MAGRSIATGICRVNRDVLEAADPDHRALWHEGDSYGAGRVRGVNAPSRFVEIDRVALLPIDQFDNVALRAAQSRRSYICKREADTSIESIVMRITWQTYILKLLYYYT